MITAYIWSASGMKGLINLCHLSLSETITCQSRFSIPAFFKHFEIDIPQTRSNRGQRRKLPPPPPNNFIYFCFRNEILAKSYILLPGAWFCPPPLQYENRCYGPVPYVNFEHPPLGLQWCIWGGMRTHPSKI